MATREEALAIKLFHQKLPQTLWTLMRTELAGQAICSEVIIEWLTKWISSVGMDEAEYIGAWCSSAPATKSAPPAPRRRGREFL